jgi:toxin-antitoxin system PIN domain toxin
VILVDSNLLVYAHVASFPQHVAARRWLDGQLNGTTAVGLPWESLLAFVRLVANPRIFERPLPVAAAWEQAKSWLGCPNVWSPQPTENHRTLLDGLLGKVATRANHVPDAHLAALALGHGLTLCSTDGDFARFTGLRYLNPLLG